jgi:hypothetical protein
LEHTAISKQELSLKSSKGIPFFYKKIYNDSISEILENIERETHYSVVDMMITNDDLVDSTYFQILDKVNFSFNSNLKKNYLVIAK